MHDHQEDPIERAAPTDDGPESKGAPVAESHYLISEHDGVTRIDIAADAQARPGPGPGQPEADTEPDAEADADTDAEADADR